MLSLIFTKTFEVSTEELETHLDNVMEELLKLESKVLSDSDISATLSHGIVNISVVASSANSDLNVAFDEALELADSTIRSAIHAAGGSTPNWVPVKTASEKLQTA